MRGVTAYGEGIRSARMRKGITQEELAALADVDVKTVRKAEHGKRMDLKTLARLSLVLGIDVSRLVVREYPTTGTDHFYVRVVEEWLNAFDARDIERLMSVYHHDAILHLPGYPDIPFGGRHVGLTEIRNATELAWKTAQTSPQHPGDCTITVSGESVFYYGLRGLHRPNGERVMLSAIHVFHFEGQKVIEHLVEYDTVAAAEILELRMPDSLTA